MPVKILELKTFTRDEWLALDKQTLKDQLEILEGTSNNDDFVVGSTPVAARRSFSLLIWRGYVSAFCGSAPFRALQANRAIMRQPSAPASQAGGYCRRDSAGRSWLSPA